ncbi:MAG TPA: LacI family DNA-binding transcriptional regulator [Symbiobacteriaceae bacterium]|nr:LacI family DNA-binding transcriptional regulator [Symbiobacteriaceae bacterium]
MATIKDVARAAGVAPSTVSRVLAGSSRISPDTQEKVRATMKALNYHPNAIARSLVHKETHTIGLVIARPAEQAFANPFFPEVMRGIGSVLYAEGYSLMLTMTANPTEERRESMRMLRQRRVDGVILTSAHIHDQLIDDLLSEGFPAVLIGRVPDLRPLSWVNNDNVAVGQMAVEHLVSRGHRRIGLISGPLDLTFTEDRHAGYSQAMLRAGLSVLPEYQVDGGFTKEGGYRAMIQLLNLPDPPTAVFCIDDAMAVGALMALKEQGKQRSVAILGVNDDPLTALIDPPLSTVRIPVFDLGATAARMLIDLLRHRVEGPRQVILPSQLVVRESTNWTLS